MPLYFLVLLLVFSGFASSAAAQCVYVEPSITVRPLQTQPQINTSVAMRDIKALSNNAAALSAHEVSVGLTVSSLAMNSSFEVKTEGRKDNLCAQISKLTLDIGFKDTVVYLASELPYGSCAYETVLEHEFKHVAADQKVLAAYLPQMPILIGNFLRQMGALPTTSPEQAEFVIREVVNKYLGEFAANLASIREREQAAIDTPAEYRRISLSCNGEVQRLANLSK